MQWKKSRYPKVRPKKFPCTNAFNNSHQENMNRLEVEPLTVALAKLEQNGIFVEVSWEVCCCGHWAKRNQVMTLSVWFRLLNLLQSIVATNVERMLLAGKRRQHNAPSLVGGNIQAVH